MTSVLLSTALVFFPTSASADAQVALIIPAGEPSSARIALTADPMRPASSNAISASWGDIGTVTDLADGFVKVSLEKGGDGWLPQADVALSVDRNGVICFEIGLSKALERNVYQDTEFFGMNTNLGESIRLEASVAAELGADISICPQSGIGQTVVLVPDDFSTPQDSNRQRMATRQPVIETLEVNFGGEFSEPAVSIESGADFSMNIEAYCLDKDRRAPSQKTQFNVSETPELLLQDSVLVALSLEDANIREIQHCLWATRHPQLLETLNWRSVAIGVFEESSDHGQGSELDIQALLIEMKRRRHSALESAYLDRVLLRPCFDQFEWYIPNEESGKLEEFIECLSETGNTCD